MKTIPGKSQKWILLLIATGILIVTWKIADYTRSTYLEQAGESLQKVLSHTHRSLQQWASVHRKTTSTWANDSRIRLLTRELLTGPQIPEVLINHPAQKQIREIIQKALSTHHYTGFCIISPDLRNLASMYPGNIGQKNLLNHQASVLRTALSGASMISLPLASDIPLIGHDKKVHANYPTMFSVAPIKNENDNVIGILAFRIDPFAEFTALLQKGSLAKTGETYAFNQYGQLVSNSRFNEQLQKIGILNTGQSSILNVTIRDPGVNLIRSPKSVSPELLKIKPLTLMAESSTSGSKGKNLDGYNDYRGVKVAGAWLWDTDLDLGMATEIDIDELYRELRHKYINITMFGILAFVLAACLLYLYNRITGKKRKPSGK